MWPGVRACIDARMLLTESLTKRGDQTSFRGGCVENAPRTRRQFCRSGISLASDRSRVSAIRAFKRCTASCPAMVAVHNSSPEALGSQSARTRGKRVLLGKKLTEHENCTGSSKWIQHMYSIEQSTHHDDSQLYRSQVFSGLCASSCRSLG